MTFKEAAEATGRARSTLQRMRADGAFPQAEKDSTGTWRIPVDDLLGAGLSLAKSATGGAEGVPTEVPTGAHRGAHEGAPLDAEVEALKLRVEVEKERGLRLAAEREVQAITAHLATAQNTIRMIETAPAQVETRVERVEVPVSVEVPVVPRWTWAVITALLLILTALVAAWVLTQRHDDPTTSSRPTTPTPAPTVVIPSSSTSTLPSDPSSIPVIVEAPSTP